MRKAGRAVFSALGELRDMQVMAEWIRQLFHAEDPVASAIQGFVSGRELALNTARQMEYDWQEDLPS